MAINILTRNELLQSLSKEELKKAITKYVIDGTMDELLEIDEISSAIINYYSNEGLGNLAEDIHYVEIPEGVVIEDKGHIDIFLTHYDAVPVEHNVFFEEETRVRVKSAVAKKLATRMELFYDNENAYSVMVSVENSCGTVEDVRNFLDVLNDIEEEHGEIKSVVLMKSGEVIRGH